MEDVDSQQVTLVTQKDTGTSKNRSSKFTRRKFFEIVGGGAVAASVGVGCAPTESEKKTLLELPEVASFMLPKGKKDVDIEKIRLNLAPSGFTPLEKIVPDILQLLQNNHIQMNGVTYQEKMHQRFSGLNPEIKVAIKRGLKERGFAGKFWHGRGNDHNTAVLDSELDPGEMMHTLAHELAHAVYGPGETRADVSTYRDIAFLSANHPSLLPPPDAGVSDRAFSPLVDLLLQEIEAGANDPRKDPNVIFQSLHNMQFLYERGEPNGRTLPEAVDFLRQSDIADSDSFYGYFTMRQKDGPTHVDRLHANTIRVIDAYIHSINPNVSILNRFSSTLASAP